MVYVKELLLQYGADLTISFYLKQIKLNFFSYLSLIFGLARPSLPHQSPSPRPVAHQSPRPPAVAHHQSGRAGYNPRQSFYGQGQRPLFQSELLDFVVFF